MRVSDFHTSKYIFLIQYLDVQIFYDTSIELKHTTFLKSFNNDGFFHLWAAYIPRIYPGCIKITYCYYVILKIYRIEV